MTRGRKNEWVEAILEGGTHSVTLVIRGLLQGIEKKSASCHKMELGGEQEVEMMEAAISMEDQRKDRDEFTEIVRENHRGLLVYARSLLRDEAEARDLVQESFLAAWKSMEKFDVTRDCGAWLRGIVRNKWKDYCRKTGRRPQFVEEDLAELEDFLVQGEESRESHDLFSALRECREKLPASFAEAVACFYDEGLSGEETANRLSLNTATLRKRLERAREALRLCLQGTTEKI